MKLQYRRQILMGFFGETLERCRKEQYPRKITPILLEHMRAINQEFTIEGKLKEKIQEYYRILKEITIYTNQVAEEGTKKHPDWEEKFKAAIDRLEELVPAIERLIREEFGEAHHYLK
jgi:hypothetical protein